MGSHCVPMGSHCVTLRSLTVSLWGSLTVCPYGGVSLCVPTVPHCVPTVPHCVPVVPHCVPMGSHCVSLWGGLTVCPSSPSLCPYGVPHCVPPVPHRVPVCPHRVPVCPHRVPVRPAAPQDAQELLVETPAERGVGAVQLAGDRDGVFVLEAQRGSGLRQGDRLLSARVFFERSEDAAQVLRSARQCRVSFCLKRRVPPPRAPPAPTAPDARGPLAKNLLSLTALRKGPPAPPPVDVELALPKLSLLSPRAVPPPGPPSVTTTTEGGIPEKGRVAEGGSPRWGSPGWGSLRCPRGGGGAGAVVGHRGAQSGGDAGAARSRRRHRRNFGSKTAQIGTFVPQSLR
eukprot:XP_025000276.1 periaxin isoform X2 [Gallus gallus]